MVKVKYIGDVPGDTFIGRLQPGEIREVNKELAEVLIRSKFELVKEPKKAVKKEE